MQQYINNETARTNKQTHKQMNNNNKTWKQKQTTSNINILANQAKHKQ